jgi:hypothetical protein
MSHCLATIRPSQIKDLMWDIICKKLVVIYVKIICHYTMRDNFIKNKFSSIKINCEVNCVAHFKFLTILLLE